SATIIDLAIRKYVRISETTQKKILKDKKAYEFTLLNTDWSGLKPHETKILRKIFETVSVGTTVKLDSLKNTFYLTVKSIATDMPKSLTTAGYFPTNPGHAGGMLWAVFAGVIILTF